MTEATDRDRHDDTVHPADAGTRSAGLGPRLLARALDALVIGLPASAILALLDLPAPTIGLGGTEVWTRSAVTALSWLAYHVLAESLFATTVGKRLVGLRVGDVDRSNMGAGTGDIERPSVGAATLRNVWILFGLVPLIGGLALLVATVGIAITILRDDRHRGLHDRLAGTTVVA